MIVSDQLVNNSQLGFVPGRYIAENGMKTQIIMEDARLKWELAKKNGIDGDFDIGLLLDQEKAYDRINLDYLQQVLEKFGFPSAIITCLYNLLAYNKIKVNVNGYFTDDVHKRRGLKQGDPISPILYNLAFEPLLRTILSDSNIQGYDMTVHNITERQALPTSDPTVINTKLHVMQMTP
jgi:hypothetical protein